MHDHSFLAVSQYSAADGPNVGSGRVTAQTSMVVQMFGRTIKTPLNTERSELEEHMKCPVKAGKIVFKYDRMLPPITPPGEYLVRVVAKDEEDKPLLCVEVKFKIEKRFLPSL